MKKTHRLHSWLRLLLWSHVAGVISFYIVLWLRTAPRYLKGAKVSSAYGLTPGGVKPFVSIIVPARNEERNIRRCVESLLEQDYDNYEVIVVDDGSSDCTPRILDELVASHAHSDRLYVLRLRDELPQGWAGKPHAIHEGTQEAHGEWLLFTDADT